MRRRSMLRLKTLSACFLALAVIATSTPGQDDVAPVTDEALIRILESAKLLPKIVEPGQIQYEIDGITIVLKNGQKDVLVQAGFETNGKADAFRIEQWNHATRDETRAYLDKDGDPWIEADLDFEQGLTPAAIRGRIVAFNTSAVRFRDQVVDKEELKAPPASSDQEVTPGLVAGVLESLSRNYRCTIEPNPAPGAAKTVYRVIVDDEELILSVDTDGRLLLRDSHKETWNPIELNEWNRDHRFARVVADAKLHPTLESALVLGPDDLTDEAIRQWFEVFLGSRKVFHTSLRGVAPAPAPPSPGTPSLPKGWSVQEVEETGFRVAMPSEPEVDRSPVESPNGRTASILLRARGGQTVYVAGRQEYPAEVAKLADEEFFREFLEGVAPKGARILSRNAVMVDGLAARDFAFEAPGPDNQQRSARVRVARDGNIGYFMLAGAPLNQLDSEAVDAYFASFRRRAQAVKPETPTANRPPATPPARERIAVAPGPVPFSSAPAPPKLFDLAQRERDIPDGWISLTFQDMEIKLALPSRPALPRVTTRQTAYGPANQRTLVVEEDGVAYGAEMWTYPDSAARFDDEAFFAQVVRDAIAPGQHTIVEPAMRLVYGGLPVRDVEYKSVLASNGANVRIRLRIFRNGSEAWVFSTLDRAEPRRSDDPGNALFGAIQLIGKPALAR